MDTRITLLGAGRQVCEKQTCKASRTASSGSKLAMYSIYFMMEKGMKSKKKQGNCIIFFFNKKTVIY